MKARMDKTALSNSSSAMEVKRMEKPLAEVSHKELVGDNEFSRGILERHTNLLQRMFPSQTVKIAKKFEAQIATIQSESRTEALRMLKEFQRQTSTEMFNTLLMRGKNDLRSDNTMIFTESLKKLQLQIQDITNEYFDEAIKQTDRIAQIQNQGIRERREQMLDARMDEFEESVNKLMADFKNIISERVDVFPS